MFLNKSFVVLALLHTGFSFEFDCFEEKGCKGNNQSVNVWDNTCADWGFTCQSYLPTAYGGSHQVGTFYNYHYCAPPNNPTSWDHWMFMWVDGGNECYQLGQCIDVGFTAFAAGSAVGGLSQGDCQLMYVVSFALGTRRQLMMNDSHPK